MADFSSYPKSEKFREQVAAEWKADPALSTEFPSFETFLALRKAEAKGRVRIAAPMFRRTDLPVSEHAPDSGQFALESVTMWDSQAHLRVEFGSLSVFHAYRQQVARAKE